MLFKKVGINILLVLVGAVILGAYGYYNGFPFLFSDTGTYIRTGFENSVPDDRTIFYGLFLRHISMKYSLFFVTFTQSLFLSYLLYLLLKRYGHSDRFHVYFIVVISGLVLFTGISFHVSRLLPDIFSGMLFLTMAILLFDLDINRIHLSVVSILFVFSNVVHLGNVMISSAMLIVLIVLGFFHFPNFEIEVRRKKLLAVLLLAVYILIPSLQFSIDGKFQYGKGSHVFLMERLIGSGTLKPYLNENCGVKDYKICAFKDSINPHTFIWGYSESPLYKTGGWEANRKDFNAIIYDVITNWKYLKIHLPSVFSNTVKQLHHFDVYARSNENRNAAGSAISRYFSKLKQNMNNSKQSLGELDFTWLNRIQQIIVYLCMALLLIICFRHSRNEKEKRLKSFVIITLLFVLINAFVCSVISGVQMRYQSRIIWIVPVALALVLPLFWSRLKDTISISKS